MSGERGDRQVPVPSAPAHALSKRSTCVKIITKENQSATSEKLSHHAKHEEKALDGNSALRKQPIGFINFQNKHQKNANGTQSNTFKNNTYSLKGT